MVPKLLQNSYLPIRRTQRTGFVFVYYVFVFVYYVFVFVYYVSVGGSTLGQNSEEYC